VIRRLRRIVRIVAAVFVGLAVLGVIYQQIGQALDRRALAPPGQSFVVEGATMHIHCTGAGPSTVVLEAGATEFSQTWAWIQPRLAERTRVCSYDRAGIGWSEEVAGHDGVAVAQRLRALLAAAGETGPYVLVGHSLGGAFIRVYVERYPDEVAALAFIEPSHPDQLDRFPAEARAAQERIHRVLPVAARLAHVGLLRLLNPLGRTATGLPPDDYRAAVMFGSSPSHLRAVYEEMIAWDTTMAAARANRTLGDRPVLVISASEVMDGMTEEFLAIGQQMHAEIASLSTRGRHVVLDGADHISLLVERDDAERVAALLGALVAEIPTRR
jgi:pimeloyl-ACP methyl ester carboxylesterase